MAASALTLSLLFAAVLCVGSGAAVADTALDDVCRSLGAYYITPELCKSALCHDPSSPCRGARDARAVAVLAAKLAAANATAARDRVRAAASGSAEPAAKAGLQSCLQLYTGFVPALEWAAGCVAAGRFPGARELLEAVHHMAAGCEGLAGAAIPRENDGFFEAAFVAHAVLAYVSKLY